MGASNLVLVPDLAGWRAGRAPDFSKNQQGLTEPPDWVCEVLSPTTRRHDLVRKRPLYAEHGVPWLWIVDPQAQLLEIFRLEPGGYLMVSTHDGDEGKIRAPPFDAVELDLKALWPPEK